MHELDEAWQRASAYRALIRERHVAPSPSALARLADFDEPFPAEPLAAAAVLELLDRLGSPATVASTGGRYFGFVTGGVLPAALAADWLASAWGQNAALSVMSPVAAKLDDLAIRWTAEALRLPAAGGALVSGATMANLTGLLAARQSLLRRHGWDVASRGLFNAPPITVVVGDEVHASLLKSLAILGLGKDRVIRVPADHQGRIRPGAFPSLNGPAIVCLQAGNVNSGAFDPAPDLIPLAKASGAWVHVDGAFGLWAAASPAFRHLMAGYELADSWATDAHKWLNAGYDCGIALLRDPASLRDALDSPAAYLAHDELRQPMHFTPESSRRARGVPVWAALKSLGQAGLAALVDRCCRHAARFAQGLRQAGLIVLNEVVLNQVTVALPAAGATRQMIAAVQQEGTSWCGATEWKGRPAMRISVSSWATTDDDVEECLDAIIRLSRGG